MTLPLITRQICPGLTGTTLLARIVGAGNTPITSSTLTSVAYILTDTTLGVQADSKTLTVAASAGGVVYDSLQTGGPWTKDGPLQPGKDGLWGWNFKYEVAAAVIANGGDVYLATVIFTPAQGYGQPFRVLFQWPTEQTYG